MPVERLDVLDGEAVETEVAQLGFDVEPHVLAVADHGLMTQLRVADGQPLLHPPRDGGNAAGRGGVVAGSQFTEQLGGVSLVPGVAPHPHPPAAHLAQVERRFPLPGAVSVHGPFAPSPRRHQATSLVSRDR